MHIALYSQTPERQLEGLRQRSLDFAMVDTPPEGKESELEYFQVLNDHMLVAIPHHHPLAEKAEITPEDLTAQQWISVLHNNDNSHSRDDFVAACVKAGFRPDIRLEAEEPLTALGLVAAGLGVTLIQNGLRYNLPKGAIVREVPWMNMTTQLWVVWHKANLRPLVIHFREILSQIQHD